MAKKDTVSLDERISAVKAIAEVLAKYNGEDQVRVIKAVLDIMGFPYSVQF